MSSRSFFPRRTPLAERLKPQAAIKTVHEAKTKKERRFALVFLFLSYPESSPEHMSKWENHKTYPDHPLTKKVKYCY